MRGSNTGSSVFLYYSLYGWGVPTAVVASTVVIHFFATIEGSATNVYNLKASCWLRSGYPLLVAFGGPVAIVLLLNLGFFGKVVVGIRSTMKATKILKKDNDKETELKQIKKELRLYTLVSETCFFNITMLCCT